MNPDEPGAEGRQWEQEDRRPRVESEDNPCVRRAIQIHDDYSGPLPLRYRLRALILADASSDEIAQRLDISAEVVRIYENRFCNVRARLKDSQYIAQNAMGMHSCKQRLSEDEPGKLLMALAYSGGVQAYDRFVGYLFNRHRFYDWLEEADSAEERLRRLDDRLTVVMHCMPETAEKDQVAFLKAQLVGAKIWPSSAQLLPEAPGFPTGGREDRSHAEAVRNEGGVETTALMGASA